ncbi:MAG: hypothetical protein JXA36_08265 [Coriobacteriia bacterium]|nr:hypothetical protein [Coriobacteriia bacterium]
MMHRNTDDESLGIRLHEVNRQRAVDRAIERLRHGLRADWHYLTSEDHANLRWVMGELWSTTSREEWEALHFSKLDLESTRRLVGTGDRLRRHGTNKMSALASAIEIVHGMSAAYTPDASRAQQPSLAY